MNKENVERILYAIYEDIKDLASQNDISEIINDALKKIQNIRK